MKALKPALPIRAGMLATFAQRLPPAGSAFSRLPGIEYRGDTVTFPVRDYPEAYERMAVLIGIAVRNGSQLMHTDRCTCRAICRNNQAKDCVSERFLTTHVPMDRCSCTTVLLSGSTSEPPSSCVTFSKRSWSTRKRVVPSGIT